MDSLFAYEIKRMKAGEQHAAAKHYTALDAFMVPPNVDEVNAVLTPCLHRASCMLQVSVASNDTYPPGMSTLAQSNAMWSASV